MEAEVTITRIVSLITALILGFVRLFLEMVFVARQHIVTGMSLITYRAFLSDRAVLVSDSGLSVSGGV